MDKKVKYMFLFLLFFTIITIIIPNTFSKYTSTISRTININTSRPRYIIKFDANGGTGSMSDMNVTRAVSQNLTTNTFTRSGYDFIGWNTQSDGSGVSYSDGQEIAYASITNGDVITLYAQWYSKNYLNYATEEEHYTCTEDVKTYTVSQTGRYVLEAWGAQGGSTSINSRGSKTMDAVAGGKGGYSYGIVNLDAGDTVYVAVGCEGKELYHASTNSTLAGGYNGGGQALADDLTNTQGSGGGATHFAINQNLGELKNYSSNQSDVLLVAGGGGGSYSSTSVNYYSIGGFGGGMVAGDAIVYYDLSVRTKALINNGYIYYQGYHIPGADQSLYSSNNTFYYGTFGKGTDAIKNYTGCDGGAGGGWYGGNKMAKRYGVGGMAGSGGSGYVNTTSLTDGKTLAGNLQIPTYDGTSYMTGNAGDGYARISYVEPHYTIKFHSNGGSGTMSDMDYSSTESKALTSNSFTRTSCTFNRWNTSADGSGTDYLDHQSVSGLASNYDAVVDLYAIWDCNIYFQLPPDWTSSDDVYVFLYDSNNINSPNYSFDNPTNDYKATKVDNDKKIFNYTVLAGEDILYYDKIVFNNLNMRKTIDLDLLTSNIGQIFVPELYSGNGTRVFYVVANYNNDVSWIPYVYKWNGGTNNGWPGEQLSSSDIVSDITFAAVIESIYNKMIFNNGGNGYQTSDLDVPIYQDLTFKNGSFFRRFYAGSWHDYSTWMSTGYTSWYSSDYVNFVLAQSALGY